MEWIKVEDKLPEDDLSVLVMLGKDKPPCQGVMMGRLSYGEWIANNSYGSSHTSKITHWMPMPDPPKEMPFRTKKLANLDYAVIHKWYGITWKTSTRETADSLCCILNEIWEVERSE